MISSLICPCRIPTPQQITQPLHVPACDPHHPIPHPHPCRLVVSHEAPVTSGFGAEVVSTISERCFWRLQAPPARVCGYDTPFPLIYEPVYLPTEARVVDAILAVAGA
jgi:hypothetical protein